MARVERNLPQRINSTEKLGDLRSYELLYAICRCKRVVEINKKAWIRQYGADAVLSKLEPALRCDECKQRGNAILAVYKLPR